MFNFKRLTTLFFILLLGMNILTFTGIHVSWVFYVLLFTAYFGISAAASFFTGSGFHMRAVCRVQTDKNEVVLTFDDGPDPVVTPQVLDILEEKGVKATFFIIGRKIEGNESIIKRIYNEGHIIGTHSFSHSAWFDFFLPRIMKNEFRETEALIMKATGKKPLFFRPPYGVINPMVKRALHGMNYEVIGFSNRAFDTTTDDPEKIILRIKNKLKKGDIILLHDTNPVVPEVLNNIIPYLEKEKYSVKPINELTGLNPYENQ